VKAVPDAGRSLRDLFKNLEHHKKMRVVTVAPGVEYVGRVLTVGSDHVVLETEFHVVTVALCHIVSLQNERT
jgi:CO dehydrogenase nickel-insertion accessory protein CooC1